MQLNTFFWIFFIEGHNLLKYVFLVVNILWSFYPHMSKKTIFLLVCSYCHFTYINFRLVARLHIP